MPATAFPQKTSYLPTAKDIVDFASPLLTDEARGQKPRAEVNWDAVDAESQEFRKELLSHVDKQTLQANTSKEQKALWRKQRGLN